MDLAAKLRTVPAFYATSLGLTAADYRHMITSTPQPLTAREGGVLQPAGLLFIIWLCVAIDGALPTVQLLFTGDVLLPPIVPKLVLIAIGTALTIFNQRWRAPPLLTAWIAAFTIYLCACSMFWPPSADLEGESENLLFYHVGFILLAVSYSCIGSLQDRTVALTIVALSVPLGVLGIAQHLSGDPLLPQDLESISSSTPEEYFNINSPGFYGQLRAFSLFTSGLNFGHFLNLAVGILISLLCTSRSHSRLIVMLLLMLCGAAVYSTLTRAVYLQLPVVAVSALLFTMIPKTRGFIGLLTVVFGILAALVVFLIEPLVELNSNDILSNDSIVLRLAEWAACWDDLTSDSVWVLLLGTGFLQGKFLIIDNGPIAVAYQAGIIGLVFWILGIVLVLRYVKSRLVASPSYLTIGVAAYVTSWLCATMFNLSTDEGPRIAILLVLSQSGASPANEDPAGVPETLNADGRSKQTAPGVPALISGPSVAFPASASSGK